MGRINPTSILAQRLNALSHDMIDLKQTFTETENALETYMKEKSDAIKTWVAKQIKLFKRELGDSYTNPEEMKKLESTIQ